MTDELKPAVRWYCVDKYGGSARLCLDQNEASEAAASRSVHFPEAVPYRAVRMLEATDEWQAAVMAAADEMRRYGIKSAISAKSYEEACEMEDIASSARARLVKLLGGAK